MTQSEPLYNVVITGIKVTIEKLDPGSAGYTAANESVIYRERDAILMYRESQAAGKSQDGTYSFASLENAKSFALLQLKTTEQAIEDNLDRIQNYAG